MRLDEFLARCLAARTLRFSRDPHGSLIAERIWRQYMPDAEFIIGALMAFDHRQIVARFYEAEDEDGE